MIEKRRRQKKKRLIVIGVVVTVVVLAMVIPVAYVTSRKSDDPEPTVTRRPNRGSSNTTSKAPDQSELARYYAADSVYNPLVCLNTTEVQQGGNGSVISSYVNGDLIEFTYVNEFGGTFFYDPTNPFAKGGKAQSWSPAIGEEWRWGRDLVRGVK
jgi:glucan 1,3-beta-glucosidase